MIVRARKYALYTLLSAVGALAWIGLGAALEAFAGALGGQR